MTSSLANTQWLPSWAMWSVNVGISIVLQPCHEVLRPVVQLPDPQAGVYRFLSTQWMPLSG